MKLRRYKKEGICVPIDFDDLDDCYNINVGYLSCIDGKDFEGDRCNRMAQKASARDMCRYMGKGENYEIRVCELQDAKKWQKTLTKEQKQQFTALEDRYNVLVK